jgi:NADH-quinone oxidoreductase subunit K
MPTSVPLEWYLILSAAIFTLGVVGVMVRRNAIVLFMSVELMLNAVNLTLLAFAKHRTEAMPGVGVHMDGHVMAFFVIALAAAEAAVGLAIVLAVFRHNRSLHVDEANALRH